MNPRCNEHIFPVTRRFVCRGSTVFNYTEHGKNYPHVVVPLFPQREWIKKIVNTNWTDE